MILYLENECEYPFLFDVEQTAKQVIEKVLEVEGCPFETEVSLYIVDRQTIKEYNNANRGIDKETDVLSFPGLNLKAPSDFSVSMEEMADCINPETNTVMFGEIVICGEKAAEQAKSYGHGIKREFAFLVAHSMLHLCGYDHMNDEEAKIMEEKQEYILTLLDITRDNA